MKISLSILFNITFEILEIEYVCVFVCIFLCNFKDVLNFFQGISFVKQNKTKLITNLEMVFKDI